MSAGGRAAGTTTAGAAWTRLLVGLAVLGVGIALMLHAEVGVATYEVVASALTVRGAPPGVAVATALVLALLLGRGLGVHPSRATVVGLVLPPAVVALVTPSLGDALVGHLGTMTAGSVVTGAGVALYLSAGLGASPGDLAYLGLLRRGYGPAVSKVVHDTGVTGLGWLLGGAIGPGTVVAVVLMGPSVALTGRLDRAVVARSERRRRGGRA